MDSIICEIEKLRENRSGRINTNNSNRYRVLYTEDDGSETAYYFAVPIYNFKTKKLIRLEFDIGEAVTKYEASNSTVAFLENVIFQNEAGRCDLDFGGYPVNKTIKSIFYDCCTVYPTLNGVAVRFKDVNRKILIKTNPDYEIRSNNKCVSFMKSKFVPFITFSCVGVLDKHNHVISEAYIAAEPTKNGEYSLSLSSPVQGDILIEINLHEQKLFEDTTVESKHPKVNNAFGTTAFIGNSSTAGETWLYSRPKQMILQDLYDKFIYKTCFWIPRLNLTARPLAAYKLSQRFCSFGSTWEKKKASTGDFSSATITSEHYKIDVTNMFTSNRVLAPQIQGFILKSRDKQDFSVLSTGDSFLAPQILEINYRR